MIISEMAILSLFKHTIKSLAPAHRRVKQEEEKHRPTRRFFLFVIIIFFVISNAPQWGQSIYI